MRRAPLLASLALAAGLTTACADTESGPASAEPIQVTVDTLGIPHISAATDDDLFFAYGYQQAFPVDVWVMKALRHLYFPKRQPRPERLQRFVDTYFGPNAGYAQQYLFHYMRTRE